MWNNIEQATDKGRKQFFAVEIFNMLAAQNIYNEELHIKGT